MTRILFAAAVAGGLVAAAPAAAQTGPAASGAASTVDARVAAGVNSLGAAVLERLRGGSAATSVLMAPYTLGAVMTVLALGASGETERAFASRLGIAGIARDDVARAHGALRRALAAEAPGITVRTANAIWVRDGIVLRPPYAALVRDAMGATAESIDLASSPAVARALERINAWVRSATNDMIPTLLDSLDPDTVVVAVSAAYFKGRWAQRFDPAATAPRPFTLANGRRHDVPMMRAVLGASYADANTYRAIAMPYAGDTYEMVVVIAKDGATLPAFLAAGAARGWASLIASAAFRPAQVSVTMPRFRAATRATLNRALSAVGLDVAFSRRADFSRMAEQPTRLSRVEYRAILEVNEEGSEAAAAVGGIVTPTSLPPPPLEFRVDRPFIAAIRHRTSGALLFLAYVADPR